MSGLILKLAPKERILLNGAVLENGDRRARLRIITPRAHILRLREALHPQSGGYAAAAALLYRAIGADGGYL